ncbi:hypothetical protein FB381_4201 [Nocardioides albertanoniae]|uniref:Fido domain-containing protein n=1 Tax=Nocardioides albertanoniae TaxID=1175486 RepID=A0A543ACG9_9ACTN|nr:Fic family protein [Nocardioides albertanoniae]TQL70272.1 hypothetical protein FB381_4201 [Nocardioides albertanoniae]
MVTKRPRWAPDPETYAARKPSEEDAYRPVADREARTHDAQMRDTGVWWTEVDTTRLRPGDTESAWRRFRANLPELVWHAARLEGNGFTLPEVRSVLAGVTVGGHLTEEELQVRALGDAYGALRDLVGYGTFGVDKSTSDRLNRILARHEAPGAGRFRGEGALRRDRSDVLRARFTTLQEHLAETGDPLLQALIYFCSAARTRFYVAGNKRTALLMMTGILMSNGFDTIVIPSARGLELDHAVDTLVATDDATELMAFLVDCAGSRPDPVRSGPVETLPTELATAEAKENSFTEDRANNGSYVANPANGISITGGRANERSFLGDRANENSFIDDPAHERPFTTHPASERSSTGDPAHERSFADNAANENSLTENLANENSFAPRRGYTRRLR